MKIIVSLLALAMAAGAASLEVRVKDATGAVVVDVAVRLKNAVGIVVEDTVTSAAGAVTLADAPAGRYSLEISKTGFAEERREVQIPAGLASQTVEVTLGLAALTERIVVSASRKEEILLESPVPILLIDQKAIEDTGGQTMEQVLLEQAGSGVYISRGFGIGFPQINGIGGNRVLVLIDGQRQFGNDNGTRDGLDLDQFPTERVERVEVVKGPSSALYGSDAMGGVINIITKQAAQPFSFDLNNNYGSFGEGNLGATMGVRHKKTGGTVSGVYQDFDGYDLTPNDRQTTGFGNGENQFIDRNLSPSIFHDFKPGATLRVNSNYYRRNATFINNQGGFTGAQTQERWNVSPVANLTLGSRSALMLRGDMSVGRRFDLDRVETLGQFEATASTLLTSTNTLQYGYDMRHKILRRPGLGSQENLTIPLGARGIRSVTVNSAWFQDEWRTWHGRLTLAAGLRVENNSQFGTNVSPKASAVLQLSQAHRLRFSFGRGFRAPDISELYTGYTTGSGFVGNPELTPEKSWGYTSGWTFNSRRLQYSLDLFLNQFDNGIGFAQVDLANPFTPFLREIIPLLPPNATLFTNRNLGDYDSKGINSEATFLIARGLQATFNYTLLDRRARTGNPNTDGVRQAGLGTVRNSSFVKLSWDRPLSVRGRRYNVRTNLRGTVRGREAIATTLVSDRPTDPTRVGQLQFVPAYATLDLLMNFGAPIGGDAFRWEPFFAINNLADYIPRGYRYADGAVVSHATSNPSIPVFREPGRTWKAGFRFHFGR